MGYIEYFLEIKPDEINPDNIREFIKKKKEESSILEYTEADALKNLKDLSKEVSAFANSGGGLLIIGISEEEKGGKIYPKEITWSSGSVPKEALDQSLHDNIDPPVKDLKIVPVRKNRTSSEVIFLIDIPKSKDIPHTVRPSSFYERLNFEKQPMKRDEIFRLMKERLSYERCALYRFWLIESLHPFMGEVIIYLSGRHAIRAKVNELFEEITKKTPDEIVELMKKLDFGVFRRLDLSFYSLKLDLDKIKRYPHNKITPEESILLQNFEEWLPSTEREISDWLLSEAKFRGIEEDKLDTLIKERIGVDEHFLHQLKSWHIRRILEICKLVLKLKKILDKMEEKYGSFYDYVSRVEESEPAT